MTAPHDDADRLDSAQSDAKPTPDSAAGGTDDATRGDSGPTDDLAAMSAPVAADRQPLNVRPADVVAAPAADHPADNPELGPLVEAVLVPATASTDVVAVDVASVPAVIEDEPPAPDSAIPVSHTVASLQQTLSDLDFTLPVPSAAGAALTRDRLSAQLADYVAPRLRDVDAPLLLVVGGSTGAGKSTLVNSILRAKVARPGVLRPTTRFPVLVHNPADESWFDGDRVFPGLARLHDVAGSSTVDDGPSALRLVAENAVPEGIALLDAPDIDSVVSENRSLARQLLAAGDVWLFVTTAARYADAVPWEVLHEAVRRGTSIALVLDRVPEEAVHEVRNDLVAMLERENLSDAPLFVVPELPLQDGFLPEEAVAEVRGFLDHLAADASDRHAMMRRTLDGALRSAATQCGELADAVADQTSAVFRLRELATAHVGGSESQLRQSLSNGTVLRGEVLARWHDLLGTSNFMRNMEARWGRLRDQIQSFFTGQPAPEVPLRQAVTAGVSEIILNRAESCIEDVRDSWGLDPAGQFLLAQYGDHLRLTPDAETRVLRLVRDWQAGVLDLVREESGSRLMQARVLSMGVNAVGVVLMVVVFAGTAFMPTGLEVAAGVGTAAVGQRVLEGIFGEDAVRRLAKKAHDDLMARAVAFFESQTQVFTEVTAALRVDEYAADRLRDAQSALAQGMA